MALFGASLAHIGLMVFKPAGAAAHHLHALLPGTQIIAIGCGRIGKLYGHIGAAKCVALYVVHIVYVDDAHYFVSALTRYIFYHVAHFAVANQCNFHFVLCLSFLF